MAGDWIKWSKGLPDKPEVVRLSSILGVSREVLVCRLMRFWEWCDETIPSDAIHETGSAFVTLSPRDGDNMAFIDALVWTPKFAESLAAVGWVRFRDGRIELPNFGRHNGETAKSRARNAKNQNRKRQNMATNNDAKPLPKDPPHVTNASPRDGDKTMTREEERRDKKENHSSTKSAADEPPPSSGSTDLVVAEPPPTTKSKAPRKTPATPHHQAIAAFTTRWQAKYGAKYLFDGKDAKHVADMLKHLDGDDAAFVRVVERYLADDEPFIANDRHSIGKLRAGFQRWQINAPPSRPRQHSNPQDRILGKIFEATQEGES